MAYIELSQIQKSFGSNRVVKDFSLAIDKGAFVSLLGPSGCGKTTVLRIVAGFEQPDSGAIVINGENVAGRRTSDRNIGMVFQSYALFPNLNVDDNVGFGLKIKGVPAHECKQRVAAMLHLIGLPDLGARYPYQLSGGQQQRVALARALAPEPRVLLLDEPLSALDAKIRVSLRQEIRDIQRKLGITTIFVTHDQEEALSISDQVVVMNAGVADQIDTPQNIYSHPRTAFVAGFVGSLNVLEAEVTNPTKREVTLSGQKFILPGKGTLPATGSAIRFGLRPEAMRTGKKQAGSISLVAQMRDVTFMGAVARIKVDADGQSLTADTFSNHRLKLPAHGEALLVSFQPGDIIPLVG